MKKYIFAVIFIMSGSLSFGQARALSGYHPTFGTAGYKYYDTLKTLIANSPLVLTDSVLTLNTVPISKGGTNLTTYATGDIIYASAANVLSKLPIGTTSQSIRVVGGVPVWRDTAAAGGGGSGWNLTGNAGTVDGTNFIGTTDNVPFSGIVNNVRSLRIDSIGVAIGNARLGFGAGNRAFNGSVTAIGFKALASQSGGVGGNTAVGILSLTALTTGVSNTAVGSNSLKSMTVDNQMTAVGVDALQAANNGSNNTAVGFRAAYSNSYSSNNTAMGVNALFSNTTGSSNTAIGIQSLYSLSGTTNASAIGSDAGRYYTGNIALTSAANSTFIGAFTKAAGNSQTNQTVIGYDATGLGSNTVMLGNSSVTTTGFYGNLRAVGGMAAAPASATDTGVLGDIRVTAGFIYVCTAANTWVRAALATW